MTTAQRMLLGAWLGLFGASCASEKTIPPTQTIVVVHSDLAVGQALTSVTAQVQTADGKRVVAAPFSFALASAPAAGRNTLPLSFGITRPPGGADSFRVVVAGFGPGSAGGSDTLLVEQKALVTFQDRRTLRLAVFLGSACAQKACSASGTDSVCYAARDGAVAAGECGPLTAPLLTDVDPEDELNGIAWPGGSVRDPIADGGMQPVPSPDSGALADSGPIDADGGATTPDAWWTHFGVGYNESFQTGGAVAADLTITATAVSGFMNMSELADDPAPLCGAGVLTATRQGSAVTGFFVSDDPDQGCGFDKGTRVDITGTVSDDGSHFSGTYIFGSASADVQPGIFEIWRRAPPYIDCKGTMNLTTGAAYPLNLSVLLGERTLSGRWDARDSRDGAVCSQGIVTGARKSAQTVEFSFVHSDPRPACSPFLGARQFQTAELSSDRKQMTGAFALPNGVRGTFRVECPIAL